MRSFSHSMPSISINPKLANCSFNLEHFSLSSHQSIARLILLLATLIALPRIEATFDKPLTNLLQALKF